jgi:hypothetical protein
MNVLNAIPPSIKGQVGFAGINSQCFDDKNPLCQQIQTVNDQFINVPDENKYFDAMTLQTRLSVPSLYQKLSEGVSNIYLSRVALDGSFVGLKFY